MAETLLPDSRYGDYAQALMDLGSGVCTPRRPQCKDCPCSRDCRALALGLAETLPCRVRAKTKPVRRAIAFVLCDGEGRVFLRRRPEKGLLAHMTEIPTSAWREGSMPTLSQARGEAPAKARWRLLTGLVDHSFSHFDLELRVASATIASDMPESAGWWADPACLGDEALPSVMRKIIRHGVREGEGT